jgi:hypothetical protein
MNSSLVTPGPVSLQPASDPEDDFIVSPNASPRVKLFEAKLLDDQIYSATSDVVEDIGTAMNDTVDMLIKQVLSWLVIIVISLFIPFLSYFQNNFENDEVIKDMDCAISDLQRWRELREKQLADELQSMSEPGPETTGDDGYSVAEAIDDPVITFKHADDKTVSVHIYHLID